MNAKTFVTMWGKKCWKTVEAEKEALLGRAGSGHSLERGGQCVCHPPPLTPTYPSHDKPNHITALQKPWEEGKTTERGRAKDRMTSLKGRLWAGQVMFGENMSVHQSSREPSLEPHSTASTHSTAHTTHTAQHSKHTQHTTHTAGNPRSVATWRAGGAAREGSHCLASLPAPEVVFPEAGPREFSYLGYTQKHFLFAEIRLKWVENALSYVAAELLFSLI